MKIYLGTNGCEQENIWMKLMQQINCYNEILDNKSNISHDISRIWSDIYRDLFARGLGILIK